MSYLFKVFKSSVVVLFLLEVWSTPIASQFEYLYSKPYPARLKVMDSVVKYYYKDYPYDFNEADRKVQEIIDYLTQQGNQLDLLNFKQQRLNSIYDWSMGKNIKYPLFVSEGMQLLHEASKHKLKAIEGRMLSLFSHFYFNIESNYRLAFEYMIKSKVVYEQLNVSEYPEKAFVYYTFAFLYYEYNDFESSLSFTGEIIREKNVEPDKLVLTYDLMGECYKNLGKYDSARICFNLVLTWLEKSTFNKTAWKGIVLGKTGETWFYQKDYIRAEKFLFEGINYCINSKVSLADNICVFAAKLSKINLVNNNYKLAYHYAILSKSNAFEFDKYRNVFKKIKSFKFHKASNNALSEYYRADNNFLKALIYQDSALLYHFKIEKLLDAKKNYIALDAINQQKIRQNEDRAIKEKMEQSMWRNILIGLIILLFIIASLVYYSLIQKQNIKTQKLLAEKELKDKEIELEQKMKIIEMEKSRMLEKKNKVIEDSLIEKDILLKEINHRVKNNLQIISSLLSLQGSRLTDDNARAAIEVSRDRVLSIAMVHQQLIKKETLTYVEINSFITDLITQLGQSFKPVDIHIKYGLKIDSGKLHIDKAVLLGLIINELLTNSYKHAFDKMKDAEIAIELKIRSKDLAHENLNVSHDTLLYMNYKDNGKGFPETLDLNNVNSLGLKLIIQLCKQLDAKVDYKFEQGACFNISFS